MRRGANIAPALAGPAGRVFAARSDPREDARTPAGNDIAFPRSEITVVPCTVKAALKWVRETHRHLPKLQGGLFAVACESELEIVGVGIAGNPSRVWQGQRKIVISRVATVGRENACSAVYGALCRAAKALGYHEAWTYTLPEEDGASLRAAGFRDMGVTAGGSYDRPSRAREFPVRPEPKRRWLRQLSTGATT